MKKRYSKSVHPECFAYSRGRNLDELAAKFDRFWEYVRPVGSDRVEIKCPCGARPSEHHFGRYYKCLACGHMHAYAVRSEEAIAEYYRTVDEYNAHYLNVDLRDRKLSSIYGPKSDYVCLQARLAGLPERPSLLDYGCGVGLFLSQCDWAGERVGVEPSEYSRVNSIVPGAMVAEIPDCMFDVATAWVVLEHAVDPGAVLQRIVDHVKPGGVVVVEVPRADCVSSHYFMRPGVLTWRHATADHLHLFSDRALFAMLDRAGLRRVEAWYYGLDALTLLASAQLDPMIAERGQLPLDAAEMCDAIVVACIKEGE